MIHDYHTTVTNKSTPIVHGWYKSGDCGNCGRVFCVDPIPFSVNHPFGPPAKRPEFPWTCNNCGKGYKAKP
jgi:hypothetical protein